MAGIAKSGDPIPDATLDSIKRTHLALKGPLETPIGDGFRSINVALRRTFDLYANVRPAYSILPKGRYQDLDLVLIRENTEGLYSGIEHYIRVGDDPRAAAESIAIITRPGSERIVRYAFEYALKHGRKKITLVHKANILKMSQGLFLDTGRMVAREYEGQVEFEERIVDAMAMRNLQCSTPSGSTSSSPPTCSATSSPTRSQGWSVDWGWRSRGQHRRQRRHLRGGPRHGPRHRRQGHRQPRRPDPRRVHAARSHR